MSDRLAVLRETVGKYRCERSWKIFPIDELVTEEETGLIVHPDYLDRLGFQETRRDTPRDNYEHHFNT